MSEDVSGFKIELDSEDAIQTMGSFRKELKAAQGEALALTEQFGETSKEALEAARKVAELRDRIADVNERASLFDPGAKFQAFGNVLNSVAGGFAAVQGAMGLFGVESEEVEKTLLRVQAAMALSQGLSTVLDASKDFQRLGAILSNITVVQRANAVANTLASGTMRLFGVATTQTGTAFNVLKGAIIATGIGALVVAIGIAIQYMTEYADAAEEAAEKQKKFNDSLLEYAKVGKDAEIQMINQQEKLDIAKAKAAGKSEQEISAIQLQAQRLRINSLKRYNKEVGDLDGKSKSDLEDAETDYQVKQLETQQKSREENEKRNKEYAAKSKQAAEKAAAERKAALDEALRAELETAEESNKLKLSEEDQAQYDLTLKFAERIKAYEKVGRDTTTLIEAYEAQSAAIYDKYRQEEAKKREEEAEKQRRQLEEDGQKEQEVLQKGFDAKMSHLEEERATYDARRSALEDFNRQVLASDKLTEEQRTELYKQMSDARRKIDNEEKASKIQALQAGASALEEFAQVAGEQTATGKALAIASTIISTYLAAQQAFASFSSLGPWGVAAGAIAAAAAVASGMMRVKKIIEVKVPGGGGGSVSTSTPSISTAGINSTTIGTAPVTPTMASGGAGMDDMLGNLKQTQQQTNTALDKLNQTLENGVTAKVMEGEVTATQGRSQKIKSGAEIGQ